MGEIVKRVKQTEFYKTMGFKNAESHIDDKHGVDIDDIYKISDLLSNIPFLYLGSLSVETLKIVVGIFS